MVENSEWWITPEWRRIRRECLSRDGYKCRRCGVHYPRGRNLTAHHIIPRHEGGGDHLENLITLCPPCHNMVEGHGLTSPAAIEGFSGEDSGPRQGWPEKPWHPLVYGGGQVNVTSLINQVCYLLDENTRLDDEMRGLVDPLNRQIERLRAEVEGLEAEVQELLSSEMCGAESEYKPRKLTDEDRAIANRVLALYGQPGFESWSKVGKALRVQRGSAWSLAHGLRKPDTRTLEYLELAEWRMKYLPQAVANLKELIGDRPILPISYSRPQAARLQRKRKRGGDGR